MQRCSIGPYVGGTIPQTLVNGWVSKTYPLLGEAALSRGSHPFDRDSRCRARQTSGVDDMIMSIVQSNRARLHLERNRERNSAILNEGDLGS
jgi:hypothetical protein